MPNLLTQNNIGGAGSPISGPFGDGVGVFGSSGLRGEFNSMFFTSTSFQYCIKLCYGGV